MNGCYQLRIQPVNGPAAACDGSWPASACRARVSLRLRQEAGAAPLRSLAVSDQCQLNVAQEPSGMAHSLFLRHCRSRKSGLGTLSTSGNDRFCLFSKRRERLLNQLIRIVAKVGSG